MNSLEFNMNWKNKLQLLFKSNFLRVSKFHQIQLHNDMMNCLQYYKFLFFEPNNWQFAWEKPRALLLRIELTIGISIEN